MKDNDTPAGLISELRKDLGSASFGGKTVARIKIATDALALSLHPHSALSAEQNQFLSRLRAVVDAFVSQQGFTELTQEQ